ncbi:MAG: hypothetical protein WC703_02185 [Candidatus Neomarinimicrobiota bacterium]
MNKKMLLCLLFVFQRLFAAFEIQTIQPDLIALGGVVSTRPNGLNPAAIGETGGLRFDAVYSNLFGLKDLQSWNGNVAWADASGTNAFRLSVGAFGGEIYQERTLQASFGRAVRQFLRVGVAVDYYHLSVAGYENAGSLGVTAGAKFYPTDNWRLSILYANVNQPKLSGSREKLPQAFAVGCQYFWEPRLEIDAEIFKDTLFPFSFRVGTRVNLWRGLNGLIGFQSNPDRFSGGLNLTLGKFRFDFAAQHHVSLPLTFYVGCGFQIK